MSRVSGASAGCLSRKTPRRPRVVVDPQDARRLPVLAEACGNDAGAKSGRAAGLFGARVRPWVLATACDGPHRRGRGVGFDDVARVRGASTPQGRFSAAVPDRRRRVPARPRGWKKHEGLGDRWIPRPRGHTRNATGGPTAAASSPPPPRRRSGTTAR